MDSLLRLTWNTLGLIGTERILQRMAGGRLTCLLEFIKLKAEGNTMRRKIAMLTIVIQFILGALGAYVLISNMYQNPSVYVVVVSFGTMLIGFAAGIKGIIQLLGNK